MEEQWTCVACVPPLFHHTRTDFEQEGNDLVSLLQFLEGK